MFSQTSGLVALGAIAAWALFLTFEDTFSMTGALFCSGALLYFLWSENGPRFRF